MKILAAIIYLFCVFGSYQAQKVCSSLEQNVDFKGSDLTFTYDAKSAQGCADLCSLIVQCNGFTFWTKTNACFLKNFTSTPSRTSASDRVSCIMVKSPSGCATNTASTGSTASTASTASSASSTTPIINPSSTTSISTTPYTGPSTSAPKCRTEQNAYYGDATLSLDFRNAQSLEECCNLCAVYGSSCAAFSFLTDNLICYVYGNPLPPKLNLTNAIGGVLSSNSANNGQSKCLSDQGAFYGDAPYSLDFKSANNLDECCSLCASYGSKCAAFSFLTDSLICYVYASPLPARLNLQNAIGGTLNPNSAYILRKYFKF